MPNQEQKTFWTEAAGPIWIAERERLDRLEAPISAALLRIADVQPSESVLDIGCGTGGTTVSVAERLTTGRVVGADLSSTLLGAAAERVRKAGVDARVELREADAQTVAFEAAHYDLCLSRLGVMFFEDPVAAFANLRRAVRPGGRLVCAVWQAFDLNPWARDPLTAVAEIVTLEPRDALAPGPFSLADPDRVHSVLGAAGWREFELHDTRVLLELGVGSDATDNQGALRDALELMTQVGPAGALHRNAEPEEREPIRARIERALSGATHAGRTTLGAAVWIVTARV